MENAADGEDPCREVMSVPSRRWGGVAVALLGLVAFGAAVAWFGIVKPQSEVDSAVSPSAALPTSPEVPSQTNPEQQASLPPRTPAPIPSDRLEARPDQPRHSAPLPAEQAKPDPPTATGDSSGPSFDVVRIEPSGESVIAGRGAPGATVEMLRNGKSHARALADTSGLFAFVPPPLAPGSHEIGLASIAPDGVRARSRESVTVVISENRATKPLVTLTSPERPTVVLSAPEPSEVKRPNASEVSAGIGTGGGATAPGPLTPSPAQSAALQGPGKQPPASRSGVKIVSVEAEEGGRLFVSGDAAAGATLRLYLNDSFIAPGGTGGDGKVSFAIGGGVRPGEYRVRLDDVDPVSGEVKSRAEVAFNVPPLLTLPLPPQVEFLAEPDARVTAARRAEPREPSSRTPGSAPAQQATDAPRSSEVMASAERPIGSPGSAPSVALSGAAGTARGIEPGVIVVPQITTATVSRGDNLWRISRRIYGQGTRYTVIYDANQAQIRNPDRIYPGQIFVLPSGDAAIAPGKPEP